MLACWTDGCWEHTVEFPKNNLKIRVTLVPDGFWDCCIVWLETSVTTMESSVLNFACSMLLGGRVGGSFLVSVFFYWFLFFIFFIWRWCQWWVSFLYSFVNHFFPHSRKWIQRGRGKSHLYFPGLTFFSLLNQLALLKILDSLKAVKTQTNWLCATELHLKVCLQWAKSQSLE